MEAKIEYLSAQECRCKFGHSDTIAARCEGDLHAEQIQDWIEDWAHLEVTSSPGDRTTPPSEDVRIYEEEFFLLVDPHEEWPIYVDCKVDASAECVAKLVDVHQFGKDPRVALQYVIDFK